MALSVGDSVEVKIDRYEHGDAIAEFGSTRIRIRYSNRGRGNQPPGAAVRAEITRQTENEIVATFESTIDADPDAEMPRQQRLVQQASKRDSSESVQKKKEAGRPVYLPPDERKRIAQKAQERLKQTALEHEQETVQEAIKQSDTVSELQSAVDDLDSEITISGDIMKRSGTDVDNIDERNLNHILQSHKF